MIIDPETLEALFEQRDDGLWGVYRFKRGWGGTVIRRLVGEGAAELIKKLAKQAKEPGKGTWSNTHFILVFDCSGIYLYILITCRLDARTAMAHAHGRLQDVH